MPLSARTNRAHVSCCKMCMPFWHRYIDRRTSHLARQRFNRQALADKLKQLRGRPRLKGVGGGGGAGARVRGGWRGWAGRGQGAQRGEAETVERLQGSAGPQVEGPSMTDSMALPASLADGHGGGGEAMAADGAAAEAAANRASMPPPPPPPPPPSHRRKTQRGRARAAQPATGPCTEPPDPATGRVAI